MGIQQMIMAAGGLDQYLVANSLRFNPGDSAYLNKTPSSSGDRRTFTLSYWIKECGKGSSPYNNPHILWSGTGSSTRGGFVHRGTGANAGKLYLFNQVSTSTNCQVWTSALTEDYSVWRHIVLSVDTNQATSTDRVKIYINGVQETLTFSTTPARYLDLQININQEHRIGRGTPDDYGNYYIADLHFVDGTALDASSFGETVDGSWVPKEYSGSYGTNGFYLKFNNTSDLGEDSAGSNDWTANSFSTSAGTGNDVLADSPTAYDDGGNGVGNYCTLNPLKNSSGTYSNGNLQLLTTAGNRHYQASFGLTSGKWYWEVEPDAGSTPGMIGIALGSKSITDNLNGAGAMSYYGVTGYKQGGNTSGVDVSYGATYTYGNIIGVALDLDSGTKTLTFYKNGASQGVAFNPDVTLGDWFPAVCAGSSVNTTTFIVNFGQRAFVYTPPTGYKALNSYNT